MTTEDFILAAWVSMLCLLWWGLFVLVPRQLRSVFRHRLWALRDEAADAMRAGRLPRVELTVWFIECLQGTIRHSKHWTLFRWLLWPVPSPREKKRLHEFIERGRAALTDEQATLLRNYEARYKSILAKQLLFGSGSGWIVIALTAISAPVVIPMMIVRRSLRRSQELIDRVLQSTVGDVATASVRLQVYDC